MIDLIMAGLFLMVMILVAISVAVILVKFCIEVLKGPDERIN